MKIGKLIEQVGGKWLLNLNVILKITLSSLAFLYIQINAISFTLFEILLKYFGKIAVVIIGLNIKVIVNWTSVLLLHIDRWKN